MTTETEKSHGQPGHLNVFTLDQDSDVTNFGVHHRVVAFCPKADAMYVRVDHKHGKREPTIAEILTAAEIQNFTNYRKDGFFSEKNVDVTEKYKSGLGDHLCTEYNFFTD